MKEEIVRKDFDSIYSAVNARLKTRINKHLTDFILISSRIKLRQSKYIILDNRDEKESIADFVCALKRKNTDFPESYCNILEATQIALKIVIYIKIEELAYLLKNQQFLIDYMQKFI